MLDRELRSVVLLETMAGKGTEIGRSFEELAQIIENVNRPDVLMFVLIPVTLQIVAMI